MKAKMLIVAAIALALLGLCPAYAQHLKTTYDTEHSQTITGIVTAFLYRNPNSFITVQVPNKAGQMVIWSIEWSGGTQLARSGIHSETLHPGDKVIITGNPSRDPEDYQMRARSVILRELQ